MITFFAAYALLWLAVLGYVARLGAGQRRLERQLEALDTARSPDEKQRSPLAA